MQSLDSGISDIAEWSPTPSKKVGYIQRVVVAVEGALKTFPFIPHIPLLLETSEVGHQFEVLATVRFAVSHIGAQRFPVV
jgi:hypothetical protein